MYVCMYVCVCVCMYVFMYVCMYIYIIYQISRLSGAPIDDQADQRLFARGVCYVTMAGSKCHLNKS